MSIQELFEKLNCKSLYITGSSILPFIKHPRDIDYVAVFDNEEKMKTAKKMSDVHFVLEGNVPEVKCYSYLFHYLNNSDNYVGEKCHFVEVDIKKMVEYANNFSSTHNKNELMKRWHRIAIIYAIDKYGYDNIPSQITGLISDLHDFKITYADYLEKIAQIS